MSFLLFAVFSPLVKIFRSWYNQSKITTIHTEEISHDKTDQNPKKITSVSRPILYLFLGLFFTLAGCVSGNLLCFLLSCIIFFPASILLFVQLFLLGKKFCIPKKVSVSMFHFSEYIQFFGQKSNV